MMPITRLKKFAALGAVSLAAAATHAQESPPATSPNGAESSFVVAPYGWAVDISGTVGLNGIAVPLDLQSTELLRGVKRGGMGYLQWRTPRGFLYGEGLEIEFGQKNFQPLFNQSADATMTMVEIGYGFTFDVDTRFPVAGVTHLSPYLGARKIKLDVSVGGPVLHQTIKEDWLDPIFGLIAEGPLSQRLSYVVKLDAGGFNTRDSDYRSAVGLLRYSFDRHWALALGYRISRFESTADSGNGLAMDVKGAGPLIGLQLSF